MNSLYLTRARLNSLDLTRASNSLDLTRASFNSVDLRRANLNSVDLRRANLNSVDLTRESNSPAGCACYTGLHHITAAVHSAHLFQIKSLCLFLNPAFLDMASTAELQQLTIFFVFVLPRHVFGREYALCHRHRPVYHKHWPGHHRN